MNVELRQGSGQANRVTTTPSGAPVARWMRRVLPVRLPVPEPPDVEAPRRPPEDAWRRRVLTAIFSYRASFVVFVLAPSFACAVYLVFIASDQYVAEARFAVRAAQFESADSKSGSIQLSSSGLPVLAGQDAYVVSSYVRSPAIFADLPGSLDLRAIYSRPEADFWARLDPKASLEQLSDYWRAMVSTYVDGPSGVVTVKVRAFRPEDAEALGKAVVSASEALVNRLSERARRDAMGHAEEEVHRAEGLVLAALSDERAFRDRRGIIDPGSKATSTSTLLLQAMTQRIELQTTYEVDLRAMSATAPTVVALKSRLDAIDGQIANLKGELTGDSADTRTVSASIAEFETLETKRLFAEKLFSFSQDALERAKERAERQSLYVAVFVPPERPEEARYPERLAMSLLIPLGFLAIWGIFALIAAAIEDHRI
jgi:capsular polysaccharide transport system permease protein